MPRLREAPLKQIAVATIDGVPLRDVEKVLTARGLFPEASPLGMAVSSTMAGAVAHATAKPPTLAEAEALAPYCMTAANEGRPLVMLCAYETVSGQAQLDRACALAHLRAHGAILCDDPDVWLETLVLVSTFGIPTGPTAAIVAPPSTWLDRQATALKNEALTRGARFSAVIPDPSRVGKVDTVLCDPGELGEVPAALRRELLVVPVTGRPEMLSDKPSLCGLRAALGAVACAGRFHERLQAGLGADALDNSPAFDEERLARQDSRRSDERIGDHETKVMLSAAGVDVTRQAVATTPSAAAAKAKKVGFPVELKPWAASAPSELDDCPMETDIATGAEVRRAFTAISHAMGEEEAPVIVRQPPPPGRELRVRVQRARPLGVFVIVEVAGWPEPVAAPAPLRPLDALELSALVTSSRAGEPDPDRKALAELLRRASYLVCRGYVASLDLFRVVAGASGQRALVVDARAIASDDGDADE
jgi:hypothetical protein